MNLRITLPGALLLLLLSTFSAAQSNSNQSGAIVGTITDILPKISRKEKRNAADFDHLPQFQGVAQQTNPDFAYYLLNLTVLLLPSILFIWQAKFILVKAFQCNDIATYAHGKPGR